MSYLFGRNILLHNESTGCITMLKAEWFPENSESPLNCINIKIEQSYQGTVIEQTIDYSTECPIILL